MNGLFLRKLTDLSFRFSTCVRAATCNFRFQSFYMADESRGWTPNADTLWFPGQLNVTVGQVHAFATVLLRACIGHRACIRYRVVACVHSLPCCCVRALVAVLLRACTPSCERQLFASVVRRLCVSIKASAAAAASAAASAAAAAAAAVVAAAAAVVVAAAFQYCWQPLCVGCGLGWLSCEERMNEQMNE